MTDKLINFFESDRFKTVGGKTMSQEEEKKLYEMKLHECIKSDKCGGVWITRVPGGWIYMDIINETTASVFVPFNNEFMETNQ